MLWLIVKKPAVFFKHIMDFAYVIMLGSVLLIANKACESNLAGDFTLIEKNKETGEWGLGKIKVSKKVPPRKIKKNILAYEIGLHDSHSIMYGRRITEFWDMEFYGTISGSSSIKDSTVSIGILVNF